jgi:hypothetical protein
MLLAAAVFIGNQACRTCHPAIFESYTKTPMAQSSGRVDSIPSTAFIATGHNYRIAENTLYFEGGSVPIDFFIGSSAAGRSYLFSRERYLFELPVTWYSRKGIWDASPGYEHDAEIRLNRAVEPSCLQCHASQVRPIFGTQNRYGELPFLENGISCERCHGPGSLHVRDPAKVQMVDPSRLDPQRRDAVCAQCHLTGEARIQRSGRKIAEFQAGEVLSDYATYFVRARGGNDLKVTSHVEKLAASACKRASGDKLWCGSCHDLHTNTTIAKTQAACTGCHSTAHHSEQQCATCHMPKLKVTDGGHGVFSDHSIPSGRKRPLSTPGRDLIAFLGTADDRSLGLAYAETGDPRARELLLKATPIDSEVLLRLAALEPNPARAGELYEAVLKTDPNQTVALVNLGALYAKGGRLEVASRLWERALTANPAIEEAALNLAKIRPPEEARAIIRRYLEFNPTSLPARALLTSYQ